MNRYFLLIGLLQLWPAITPVNPVTTLAPLAFIFMVSAVREAVDDYFRHRSDKKANEREVVVLREGRRDKITSAELCVGDLVLVRCDEDFPADLVCVATSEDGLCYIQTANLDGESDLKARVAPAQTKSLAVDEAWKLRCCIECPTPNADVYRFDASMRLLDEHSPPSEAFPLSASHLLLQATHLRNTDWIVGLVVYAGGETKIGQNKREVPTKWTKMDRFINRVTMVIFALQLLVILVFGAVGNHWKTKYGDHLSYLDYPRYTHRRDPWYEVLIIPLRYLLLCSIMIPISLKVSLDVCKYVYAMFINWDLAMRDPDSGEFAVANSSTIAEDLGQIEYVMTDKTGTLTENVMRFQSCAIRGLVYGVDHEHGALTDASLAATAASDPVTADFFRCFALCNTVVVSVEGAEYTYKASSPDEEALVKAAAHLGFPLHHRGSNSLVRIKTPSGQAEDYELLNVLEFSSDRKRMSVVVRESASGRLRLFCKGADDKIRERLAHPMTGGDEAALESFASQGLRTLCVAHRDLSASEYAAWDAQHREAALVVNGREQAVAAVNGQLEVGLSLLGISAIEDKLQEGVPETISTLREAGLRFWMLTGDKYSTAVQIATSCRLITPAPKGILAAVEGETAAEVHRSIDACLRSHDISHKDFAIIIEGRTLAVALAEARDDFRRLGMMCRSVICCRVTPAQKALVVALVKDTGAMCLAIGDGGNDVSMIQEAQVGVGISGREGLQAARSADYAIGKFAFLGRLLLVHGHYSLYRSSFLAQYSFYKSMTMAIIQVGFALVSGYAGSSFFNTFSLTTYNVIFTGAPVVAFAITDKHLSVDTLLSVPKAYSEAVRGAYLNLRSVFGWIGLSAFHGVAMLAAGLGIYGPSYLSRQGDPEDYESTPVAVFTALIIQQTLLVALNAHYFSGILHLVLWSTLAALFASLLVVATVVQFGMFYVTFHLFNEPHFWFAITILVAITMVPYVAGKFWCFEFTPEPWQQLQRDEYRSTGSRFNPNEKEANIRAPLLGRGLRRSSSGEDFASSRPMIAV
jgi:phospholipid-translocating ATPase